VATSNANIPAVTFITADLPVRCHQRNHMKSSARPVFVDWPLFPAESQTKERRNLPHELYCE
jgi:hypothetical protein